LDTFELAEQKRPWVKSPHDFVKCHKWTILYYLNPFFHLTKAMFELPLRQRETVCPSYAADVGDVDVVHRNLVISGCIVLFVLVKLHLPPGKNTQK
jgi:hypothetical protein